MVIRNFWSVVFFSQKRRRDGGLKRSHQKKRSEKGRRREEGRAKKSLRFLLQMSLQYPNFWRLFFGGFGARVQDGGTDK